MFVAFLITMPAGTITALQIQERDKERINVFIDHTFALGVSLRTLQEQTLHKGKVLDEYAWEQLVRAEQLDKSYNAALHFLAARPRSVQEIRTRLKRKEYPEDHIDAAIERLKRIGLVDDDAFARWWIENRSQTRPRSARALQAELMRKGVDRATIEAQLATLVSADDEHDHARTVAQKAFRRYQNEKDKTTFQRKMGAYLGRRGFGWDIIKPILDELWDDTV